MLQLFWSGIMLELLLICVFHTPSCVSTSKPQGRGGGRRSRGGSTEVQDVQNPACEMSMMQFDAIAIVPALIGGAIVATITAIVMGTCVYVFKWGNNRQMRERPLVADAKDAAAKLCRALALRLRSLCPRFCRRASKSLKSSKVLPVDEHGEPFSADKKAPAAEPSSPRELAAKPADHEVSDELVPFQREGSPPAACPEPEPKLVLVNYSPPQSPPEKESRLFQERIPRLDSLSTSTGTVPGSGSSPSPSACGGPGGSGTPSESPVTSGSGSRDGDELASPAGDLCPLCLEPLGGGAGTMSMPLCEHIIHAHCALDMANRCGTACPVCRTQHPELQAVASRSSIDSLEEAAALSVDTPETAPPAGAAPKSIKRHTTLDKINITKELTADRLSLAAKVAARNGLKEMKKLEADAGKFHNFGAVALAQLKQHTERSGWRSDRCVSVRMTLAWLFNLCVYFVSALLSLTYGVKFGPESTNEMITVWFIAMFQIYFLVEPMQILVVVCAPFLCDDATRCGRCCLRIRYCYNEFFSP
jgi:hypothetical protein